MIDSWETDASLLQTHSALMCSLSAFGEPHKGADHPQGPFLFPGLRAQALAKHVIQRQHSYNPVLLDSLAHSFPEILVPHL